MKQSDDVWGIGPHPIQEEMLNRYNDPSFSIASLESEGFIAILEIDVESSLIRGRFVHDLGLPDFWGRTVVGAKAAFHELVRRKRAQAANDQGLTTTRNPTNLPPLLPRQFSEWFPDLTKPYRGNMISVLIGMDRTIRLMKKHFYDIEISNDESKRLSIKEFQLCVKFLASFMESYAPMPSKMGWTIWRLSEELSLIAAGGQPQFLRPAPYSGTKSGEPKHRALRLECACTVASLMRRGVTRDEACKKVATLLSNLNISTKKSGDQISARTILAFYNHIRSAAEKQGKIAIAEDKIFSDENKFLISCECDTEERDPTGKGEAFPEINGHPPLTNLRERLDLLLPII